MSDHSNKDEKDLDIKTNKGAEKDGVTSFDELAEDQETVSESLSPKNHIEEPLSLAEEELLHSDTSLTDDLDLPDFDNSFASELNDVDHLEDESLNMVAEDDYTPVLDVEGDADELSLDEDLQIDMSESQEIEIVMNPTFDAVKQSASDPFPLPSDLLPEGGVLDEPIPSLEATASKELNVDFDLEDSDVEIKSIEEDVLEPLEIESASIEDNSLGVPLSAPDMEDVSSLEGVESKSPLGDLDLDISFDEEEILEMEEVPDLSMGSFSQNLTEDEMEQKFFKETISLKVEDLYSNVLKVLYEVDDLSMDATAKGRVGQALKLKKLPQLICRDLVIQKIVTPVQLSRAIARTQKRKEITSFLNIPHEAMGLRQSLDSRVCGLLREARAIPLWHKVASEEDDKSISELHLAHEAPTKNLVLEAAISEYLPDHKFVWHFALRDVCGAFWLSGEDEDVDSSMEADALLDRIIGNAIDARSSDIHIDPSIKGDFKAMVRYRVDGFVQSKEVITLDQLQRLRIRIENIARMPKVDLHHPNKGAFTRSGYDWRIQIQPHAGRQGPLPRVVIRRLNPDVMAMEQLGYPEYFIQYVREASKSPNGVVLWTGPTGSGKTESIHSAIVSANPMGRGLSVHTIEDPPEKRVAGYAVQMELSDNDPARSGLELLKSSLRADPDVIVFGEVRDPQMAGLVFEAANTGHLVFSTLHTNTSLDAIIRLDELGIFGFNISYVRGIAAQRLIRRLCTHCKQPVGEVDEYTQYVFNKFEVDMDGSKLFTHDPNGCASCNYTGYHGRIAIAEWLFPNKELVNISVAQDYTELEEVARRAGWKPMGYMGVLHMKNGITDVHELSSKVQELAGDI